MATLTRVINKTDEAVFSLGTRNLFRPPLKQIGNSIHEIRTHYMSDDAINIVPKILPPHLNRIRSSIIRLLEGESFLYKNNVVTGSAIKAPEDNKHGVPCFVVLMDSLALAMNLEISPRPSDVQCDVLLAICGQPVIVLTLVDGDKDSENVAMYNTSVASGVTAKLREFMDERVNVVFGVMLLTDLETLDTFKLSIVAISKESSLYVSKSSLTTSPSKYEKIVTAFWAGVSETRSIISSDCQVDTDYLIFLTKDQCIILMENINNREVEVQFWPGTGATTLMVEVAKRLAKLGHTLFICRSRKEKERLRFVDINVETVEDLRRSDLSKYTNIVDETGTLTSHFGNKLWKFIKSYSELEILQRTVEILEKENANREKYILLLSSVDRQDKYKHLQREVETLKLFDISFQGFLSAYHLPTNLALEFLPVKHNPSGEGGSDRRQETEEHVRQILDQFKRGIHGRRDLFPLLGYMTKHTKGILFYAQAKVDFLKMVTSDGLECEDWKNQADISPDQDVSSIDPKKHGVKKEKQHKPGSTRSTVSQTIHGQRSQNLIPETEGDGGNVLDPVKSGKQERRKLLPFISKMQKRMKGFIPYLQAKVRNLKSASLNRATMEDKTSKADISVDHDALKMEARHEEQTDEQNKTGSTRSHNSKTEERYLVSGGGTEKTQFMADSVTEVTDAEKMKELSDRLKTLEMEADSQKRDFGELGEATYHGVEWEYNMGCLAEEMSKLKIQEIVTDVIGEDELPVQTEPNKETAFLVEDRITMIPELKRGQIYHLREREYGTLKERHILDILKIVIKDDQSRLTDLRTQSDHLECVYGSPIHMVGEIDTDHGGPVSCPPMTLNRERVNERLAVSGDGLKLVNWRGWSLDHPTDRFKNYWGTSSRLPIPLPPSPSTLTAATYWETHTRLQVKKDVSRKYLLEMAVCGEGEVDTSLLVSFQSRSSWGFLVRYCDEHRGVCTQVWENWRQVGECQTDTMSLTPGTDVTLKYGIALDVGRGRLAFIDVNRGRVLHKFDVNFRESLFPMFVVWPLPDDVHATMRLISGREVAMTGEKQQLIAQALFCK